MPSVQYSDEIYQQFKQKDYESNQKDALKESNFFTDSQLKDMDKDLLQVTIAT